MLKNIALKSSGLFKFRVFIKRSLKATQNKQIKDIGKFEEFGGLKSTAEWILSLNGVKTVFVESWWLDMDKRG